MAGDENEVENPEHREKDKKKTEKKDKTVSNDNNLSGSSSGSGSSSSKSRNSGSSSSGSSSRTLNMADIMKKLSDVMDEKLSSHMGRIDQRLEEFEHDYDDDYEEEDNPSTVSELDLDNLLSRVESGNSRERSHDPPSNAGANANGGNLTDEPSKERAGSSSSIAIESVASGSKDSDNLWQKIAEEFTQDDSVGPDINEALAEMINSLFTKKINEDAMAKKMKNVLRPKNCPNLVTPRINHLIWDRLRPNTRSFDIKLQKTQNCVLKAVCGIVEVLSLNGTIPVASVNTKLVSCVAMLSHGLGEFNMRRRALIKPDLSYVYKNMCSSQIPVTDELFGGDLHKLMKDISESQRIVNKMGPSRGSRDSRNYNNYNNYNGPHRGKRGRHHRGRGNRGGYHPYERPFLGEGSQSSQHRDQGSKKGNKN